MWVSLGSAMKAKQSKGKAYASPSGSVRSHNSGRCVPRASVPNGEKVPALVHWRACTIRPSYAVDEGVGDETIIPIKALQPGSRNAHLQNFVQNGLQTKLPQGVQKVTL